MARDRRSINEWGLKLTPQETVGPWQEVKIVSKEDEAAAAIARLEGLRAELLKILAKQIQARLIAANIKPRPAVASGRDLLGDLRSRQIEIQKSTAAVAKTLDAAERRELRSIKRVLDSLALGGMIEAVALCDEMLKATSADNSRGLTAPGVESPDSRTNRGLLAPGYFNEKSSRLTAVQDQIIDVLRKLLDVARRAEDALLPELEKRAGGDLPDDVKNKLETLRDKLDKFLEQQKKVIEASRESGQDAGRRFHRGGGGIAQGAGRGRGRSVAVHEGVANAT